MTPRRKKLSEVYEKIAEARQLIHKNSQMSMARFKEALHATKMTKPSSCTLHPITEQSENEEPFRVHTRSRGKAIEMLNVQTSTLEYKRKNTQ